MQNRSRTLLWMVILLLAVVQQIFFAGYTMDDAFISFRYARNVAGGHGWVYNVGAEPVEGFTNFLWTLLLVPCFWFRLDPMLTAQSLGALCSLGVLWLTLCLAESGVENPRGRMPLWAPFLLCVTGSFTYQAVTGLETHLFTLGLTFAIYFFLRGDARSLAWSAAGFAVASLTRPEGLLLYGVSFLFLFAGWRRRHVERASLLTFALVYFIPLSLFFLWRVATFGDWLPNTYYAKVGPPGEMLAEGAKYVYGFSRTHGTTLPWALALLPVVWYRRRPREVYLLLMLVAHLFIVAYEGGDWMPLHRLIAPILPVLFVLITEGFDVLRQAWRTLEERRGSSFPWMKGLVGAWLVLIAAVLFYPSIPVMREARVRPALYERSHVAMGRWLARNCSPDDRVALSDIGQIGYYSDLWVIDLVGLTDRTIARSPGGLHKKQYDPEYVLDQEPKYIVLVCAKVGGGFVIRGFETDKRLYRHPRFQANYQLQLEPSQHFFYKDAYSYWIFERNEA